MLVTAQGLLPYFQRSEVHELIAALAGRLPGSLFVFDVVPEKMLELVRKTSGPERDQAVELWSWSFSPQERAAISQITGVASVKDLVPPRAPGMTAGDSSGCSPSTAQGALRTARISGPPRQVPLTRAPR